MAIKLKYIGKGFLPGAPARDLSEADIKKSGYSEDELVASGLYAKESKPKSSKSSSKKEDKEEKAEEIIEALEENE
jgi:hypothetical protein